MCRCADGWWRRSWCSSGWRRPPSWAPAAGLLGVKARAALKLDGSSRVFLVNTEGATDPARYAELVGLKPEEVA